MSDQERISQLEVLVTNLTTRDVANARRVAVAEGAVRAKDNEIAGLDRRIDKMAEDYRRAQIEIARLVVDVETYREELLAAKKRWWRR